MPFYLTLSIISGVIQGKEMHPPLHLGVVAFEKGALGSPSTKVGRFTSHKWIPAESERIYLGFTETDHPNNYK